MRCDTLWTDARLATMAGDALGIVEDGVVAARDGLIVYAGARVEAPALTPGRRSPAPDAGSRRA